MQWCFFCAVWNGLERPDQPARQACAMFINQQNKVTVPFCRLPTNYHLHTHLSTELTYFPRPNLHYSFLTELGCRKMLKGDKQFLHHCKQKSKKKNPWDISTTNSKKRGFIYMGFQAVMADVIFEMTVLPHKEEKQCQDAHPLQASQQISAQQFMFPKTYLQQHFSR